jgi:hypothetical protein
MQLKKTGKKNRKRGREPSHAIRHRRGGKGVPTFLGMEHTELSFGTKHLCEPRVKMCQNQSNTDKDSKSTRAPVRDGHTEQDEENK